MQAIDFCIRFAAERNQPLALNLSYGNNYGSHTGTSLLETYLDEAALVGRTTICIGSGNEGNLRRHASGQLEAGREKVVEFSVSPYETSLSIQLWKQYVDSFQITLTTPSGSQIVVSEETAGTFRSLQDGMEILWYFGEPSPYQILQEIYLEIIPVSDRAMIQGGIWKLTLMPKQLVDGRFELWMPSGAQINEETGFLVSESALTLTIPSTAMRPITVAAYDANTDTYAAIFRARLRLLQSEQAGSFGTRCRYFVLCTRWRIYKKKRNLNGVSICHRKRRSDHAIWNYQWKRCLLIWSESKSLSHPRR